MRIDLPEPDIFHQMLETETGKKINQQITGITLDTREAKPGDLYVALKGEKTDGHKYLAQADAGGCSAALVSSPDNSINLTQIPVTDPEISIANIAKSWRKNLTSPVIGITGSNGKTTTKDLLIHIFSAISTVHGTRGNYNTHLGLPLTLLEQTTKADITILEMGANVIGDIGYLCDIALPRYGLITNIAPAHLQHFGSLENVVKSKGELFESLPSDGIAFINQEDDNIKSISTSAQTVKYGFSPECDFTSDITRLENGFISLTINGYEVNLNSYNETFAKNVVAACAVAITLNVSWEIFREQVLNFTGTEGRCQIEHFNGITIIDDTYNANLTSTLAAIDFLLSIPADGKLIVVFGDMLELGDVSEEHHRAVGKKCLEAKVDALFCYGEESNLSVEAVKNSIMANHYNDKQSLAADLKSLIKPGDAVLFKGSRGMAMETIIKEVFNK